MSKKKNAVRRLTANEKSALDILNDIKALVTRFNLVCSEEFGDTLKVIGVGEAEKEKELWTLRTIAYTEQEMLDAVALCLHEFFGFGEARQVKFHDAFEKKFEEIHDLRKDDSEDGDYAREIIEKALRAAYGSHYTPRKERYTITIRDTAGNVLFSAEGVE